MRVRRRQALCIMTANEPEKCCGPTFSCFCESVGLLNFWVIYSHAQFRISAKVIFWNKTLHRKVLDSRRPPH
jgi:hypothetical protein